MLTKALPYVGAAVGAWILTDGSRPKFANTFTAAQSARLYAQLVDYRAPFTTPVGMFAQPAVRTKFWRGEKGVLKVGEQSAQVAISQALAAERFVFVRTQLATASVPPNDFDVFMLRPEAVKDFIATSPYMSIFVAPQGYYASGEPIV